MALALDEHTRLPPLRRDVSEGHVADWLEETGGLTIDDEPAALARRRG
jgi:hypothetical protein